MKLDQSAQARHWGPGSLWPQCHSTKYLMGSFYHQFLGFQNSVIKINTCLLSPCIIGSLKNPMHPVAGSTGLLGSKHSLEPSLYRTEGGGRELSTGWRQGLHHRGNIILWTARPLVIRKQSFCTGCLQMQRSPRENSPRDPPGIHARGHSSAAGGMDQEFQYRLLLQGT